MNDASQTILLIGVTGGVGEAVADALVERGHEVIVTCRSEASRSALRETGRYRHVALLDLGSNASVDSAFSELGALGITQLHGLINCAASMHGTPLEIVQQEEVERLFQTNVFGTLRAVQRAIPMLRPTRGRIVLVGSMAGTFVAPMSGAYSASKFALEAVADALRRELFPWGITTSLVKPGAIDTRMFKDHLQNITNDRQMLGADDASLYAALYAAHERTIPRMGGLAVAASVVAKDVVHAMTVPRPRARYYPGADSKVTALLARFAPDRVLDWMTRRMFSLS